MARILLVNEDRTVLQLVTDTLRNNGHDVVAEQRNSAAHATAVGQQTESQTVDLVLGLVWVLTLCGVLACVKARGNRQQQGAARPQEELQLHNAEKQ